jgi:hypothetical protein
VGGADKLDTIEGRASATRAGQQIVLYAKSQGLWWVQPFTARPFTNIQADSRWKSSTHLGTDYAAVLVEAGYTPSDTAEVLPSPGAGVVTVAVIKGTGPEIPPTPEQVRIAHKMLAGSPRKRGKIVLSIGA